MRKIGCSPSRPLFVLENISQMIEAYGADISQSARSVLHSQIISLYEPYSEIDRINFNPMGFAYVAHLRLLLMMYLATLPLALVEQMGYTTIPVFWVIAYALMSLEMLAVEVENPFGFQGSDLRLFKYNTLLRDTVLESWHGWLHNSAAKHTDDMEEEEKYAKFGTDMSDDVHSNLFEFW